MIQLHQISLYRRQNKCFPGEEMGLCLGRPVDSAVPAAPASRHIHDKAVWTIGDDHTGLLTIDTAHYSHLSYKNSHNLVVRTDRGTLFALFEGIGQHGGSIAASAALATKGCFDEASRRLEEENDESILRETLHMIHQECLSVPHLAPFVRSSGCAAVMALLKRDRSQLTVANCGHAGAILCGIKGSFNAIRPSWEWLSTPHTTNSLQERVRAGSKRGGMDANLPLVESKGLVQEVPLLQVELGSVSSNDIATTSYITRAIGCLAISNEASKKNSNRFQPMISVSTTTIDLKGSMMSSRHGVQIVLGTSGLFDVLGPVSIVLRSHLFHKLREMKDRIAHASARTGASLPTPATVPDNLAEHLVYFALTRLAEKFQKPLFEYFGSLVSVDDLMTLPFDREDLDKKTTVQTSGCPTTAIEGPSNSRTDHGDTDVKAKENDTIVCEGKGTRLLMRRDVHKDLSCMVVTISHPKDDDGIHSESNRLPRVTNDPLRNLALLRWDQFRFLVTFHRLFRREMLQRWHETIAETYARERKRVRIENERIRLQQSVKVDAFLAGNL